MKQTFRNIIKYASRVAPLAGAWIETIPTQDELKAEYVAPLAGAWIETG